MAVARARSAAPVERVAAQARIIGGGRRGARVRDKVRGRGQRVGGKVSIVGRVRGFARRARLEQARRQLGAEALVGFVIANPVAHSRGAEFCLELLHGLTRNLARGGCLEHL
jgi:hypothetical protein